MLEVSLLDSPVLEYVWCYHVSTDSISLVCKIITEYIYIYISLVACYTCNNSFKPNQNSSI